MVCLQVFVSTVQLGSLHGYGHDPESDAVHRRCSASAAGPALAFALFATDSFVHAPRV